MWNSPEDSNKNLHYCRNLKSHWRTITITQGTYKVTTLLV